MGEECEGYGKNCNAKINCRQEYACYNKKAKKEENMNFTGHKKLTDEEFKKWYPQLFEKCPRHKEYGTDEYNKKVQQRRKEFFDAQEKELMIPELPGEKWEPHPTLKTYKISNKGRVKIRGKIQKQIDDPDGKLGYLVLENYSSVLVYQLVADTFLGRLEREDGITRAVHHINNNGYDCSEDNLIMLTDNQHNAIHRNEMEER